MQRGRGCETNGWRTCSKTAAAKTGNQALDSEGREKRRRAPKARSCISGRRGRRLKIRRHGRRRSSARLKLDWRGEGERADFFTFCCTHHQHFRYALSASKDYKFSFSYF